MRKAVDKMVELYRTNPVFQDLVESASATAVAAGGQALLTDMTPEEIALASTVGFGAGMVGRPIVGRAGQAIGGVFDKQRPQMSKILGDRFRSGEVLEGMPEAMQEIMKSKMNPYRNLGGFSQMGQLLGRGYGDNVAQLIIGLGAPAVMGGEENA